MDPEFGDTLEEVSGIGDALGFHVAQNGNDMYKAINGLLGDPGKSIEEMTVRSRLDKELGPAMVIQQSKAFAILAQARRENEKKFKSSVPTQFKYEEMPASQRAVMFRLNTEMPGDGESRYEFTSALTGGMFNRAKAMGSSVASALAGAGRRRAKSEKLSG